jgi:hypothetical protein
MSVPFLVASLNVIMASVVILNVVTPTSQTNNNHHNDIQQRYKKWATQHHNTNAYPECPKRLYVNSHFFTLDIFSV